MTALAITPSADLAALAGQARDYGEAAKAPATLRAYRADWRQFTAWCSDRGLDPLPAAPATVALYLTDHAGVKATATLQRHLTSISEAHKATGHRSPTTHETVRQVWKGIKRALGVASRGKAPLLTDDIRAMVAQLGDSPLDVRDRALVLLLFAGALRRSELVALNVDDITETPDGLVLTIRRSKADQEGEGATVGIPYGADPATCPVRAYRRHLEVSGIVEGAIFRTMRDGARMSGRAAAARVQRLAALIGRDVATIGAHSLRAGLITQAVRNGAHERDVMRHSRHRSVAMLRTYIRGLDVFEANAAATAGL
jgi:site-specific recombinase XerD